MTAATDNFGIEFARRHGKSVITPAFVFSVAAHAAVGGILLHNWHQAAFDPIEPPLTVKLEAAPPPPAIEVPVPPPPQIKPPTPVKHEHKVVVPRAPVAPVQPVIAVERTDAAPTSVVSPPIETPPAPVVVAKAPTTTAPTRPEAIEPPHFDVAYLNNPRPAYPPMARKLGMEGVVLLRVDVSAKGTPDKIVIAHSSGASLLDEAAVKAVQGWTFVPARRGEAPIPHPVEVPIRFQLKN